MAAGSVALVGAGLALAYVDRHLVPASLNNWAFSSVSGQVLNVAVPVTGFVLASRRPENRIGWLRWIMIHMIEEYARQCGHADLLRERIDGTVGA